MGELDLLFAEARDASRHVPASLTQRVLADADNVQAGFGAASVPTQADRRGVWAQLLAVLGGWPTMGGLVAACAAGIWIGVAPPSFMPDPADYVPGQVSDIDLIGMDDLAAALPEDG